MSRAELRKAAILLLNLPGGSAGALLSRLEPHQVETVTTEMARVGSLAPGELETVLLELARGATPVGGVEPHDPSHTNGTTPGARGESMSRMPTNGLGCRPPFAYLRHLDCRSLSRLLDGERPQTVALVASQVPAAYGAELISSLAAERRIAVMRALAAIEPTDPEVVADVARALARRVSRLAA